MLVALEKAGHWFGSRRILEGIDLHLNLGDRLGLIGRNGCGKTTLLKILGGELTPDEGERHTAKGASMALLRQRDHFEGGELGHEDMTLEAAALEQFTDLIREGEALQRMEAELEHADAAQLERYGKARDRFEQRGGYRYESEARRMLAAVGFAAEAERSRRIRSLSGGERGRLALALTLLRQPDLLLLDEPTNHLDIESTERLEAVLQEYPGAVLLVSHDRTFLDRVCQRTALLERGRLTVFDGGYTKAMRALEAWREQQLALVAQQQKEIAKTEAFIERFRYKATKAKQVQSRVKSLEKTERLQAPEGSENTMKLRFDIGDAGDHQMLRVTGACKAFGARVLFDGVDLDVYRGDKLGIVGPNGSGKSTLVKCLLGREPLDAGVAVPGERVRIGYYEQDLRSLDTDRSVLDLLRALKPSASPTELRGYAARFLFSGEDALRPLGPMSGGEKARAALCELMLRGTNMLVLDEPTNHLDIPARQALEEALADYPGTVVVVSHDRWFLDAVVDRVALVDDGKVRAFPGSFGELREKQAQEAREAASTSAEDGAPKPTEKKRGHLHRENIKLRRAAQKRLDTAEVRVAELETLIEAHDAALADPANADNWELLGELQQRRESDATALNHAVKEWEAAAEALEQLDEGAG